MFKFKPVDLGVAIAILCITFLEAMALSHGINGKVFLTSIALIAGLAGFRLGQWRSERSDNKNGIITP